MVDIYQARALFFDQAEPRGRFEFLCSDDLCRSNNATKVTGVNYDKVVENSPGIVIRSHFRMNSKSQHISACEWMMRQGGEAEGGSRVRDQRHAGDVSRGRKTNDVVDVFLPQARVPLRGNKCLQQAAKEDTFQTRSHLVDNSHPSTNLTRSEFLETVVSAYESLDPRDRRRARLRIASGPKLPYSKAFCRIEHYFVVGGPRIYHGGVSVRRHGPNFSVRFFDSVVTHENDDKVALGVSLYLKRDALLTHWNGRFLIAQLHEAMNANNYAHCYFFGRLVPHRTLPRRLTVDYSSLEQIVFVVRKKQTSASGSRTISFHLSVGCQKRAP